MTMSGITARRHAMMPLRSASVTRGPDSGRGGRLELVDDEGGYEVCAAGSAYGRAFFGGDELLDAVCMARCEARCGNTRHHQLRAMLRGRGSGSCLPLTAPVSRDCLDRGGDEVGIVGTSKSTRRGRRDGRRRGSFIAGSKQARAFRIRQHGGRSP